MLDKILEISFTTIGAYATIQIVDAFVRFNS